MHAFDKVDDKANLVHEYFRLHRSHKHRYGDDCVVLMQVGSFHEAYQTDDDGPSLQRLSELLNMVVSKKNKSIGEVSLKNPYMLGFPSVTLGKYLRVLVDCGLTVVVVDQVTAPPNPKRAITGVYTSGTYMDDAQPDANHVMSLFVEEMPSRHGGTVLACGIAIVDVTTNRVAVHESVSDCGTDGYLPLDEAMKLLVGFHVREVVLTHTGLRRKLTDVLAYLDLLNKKCLTYEASDSRSVLHGTGQRLSFQSQLLARAYPSVSQADIFQQLNVEDIPFARQALVVLVSYLYDHSQVVTRGLALPERYRSDNILDLGNCALLQLNVISAGVTPTGSAARGAPRSLFDVLNKASTAMGRRLLKHRLAHPFALAEDMSSRYEAIAAMTPLIDHIEDGLRQVPDLERLARRTALQLLGPNDLACMVKGLDAAFEVFNLVATRMPDALFAKVAPTMQGLLTFFDRVRSCIDLDQAAVYSLNDVAGNVFRAGVHADVDALQQRITSASQYITVVAAELNAYLEKKLNSRGEAIRVECNDRDGHYLVTTKRRADLLERWLRDSPLHTAALTLNASDLEFRHLPRGNTAKVFMRDVQRRSVEIQQLTEQLRVLATQRFLEFLATLDAQVLTTAAELVAELDFLKSGAKVAAMYHYAKPLLLDGGRSCVRACELRHPIIERLHPEKEYVPVDIHVGMDGQDGVLLFGLNSAGKSSLQKALGLAVIMAQIGYYVPASRFALRPYNSLFTRITGQDNIFKGLSSFALELTELRAILKRATPNTLVIADEVCRGTEHTSSLIIVMTMIDLLSRSGTSFITATHLHELTRMPALAALPNVRSYHLHVGYDERTNVLTYDRQLRHGSGEDFYGLNVAKCIMDDRTFLTTALRIKADMCHDGLLSKKRSNYSADLFMTECRVCGRRPRAGEVPLETHHIHFRRDFDGAGVHKGKSHILKNQAANLVVLCAGCHDKIDTGELLISGYKETSKGLILDCTINGNT